MADDIKTTGARAPRMPAQTDIPHLYFNGFSGALTSGDVEFVLELNGIPVAVLNMSYTVAKTLGVAIGSIISNLEEATTNTIMTSADIQRALEKLTSGKGDA